MMSPHRHNECAKRRSVALHLLVAVRTAMVDESVDLVAGDFNGTSWRRKRDSVNEQAFIDTMFTLPSGPHTVVGRGETPL